MKLMFDVEVEHLLGLGRVGLIEGGKLLVVLVDIDCLMFGNDVVPFQLSFVDKMIVVVVGRLLIEDLS